MSTAAPVRRASSHRRWWLWAVLFPVALWLAVWGDKQPTASNGSGASGISGASSTSSASVAPVPPSTRVVSSATAASSGAGGFASFGAAPVGSAPLDFQAEHPLERSQFIGVPAATGLQLQRDLFRSVNWNPPPVALAPVAPPAPTASPLPFVFQGKKLQDGQWEVYLGQGEQTLVVRVGSNPSNLYRVDAITPTQLHMTYLPLDISQTLAIGDTP